MVNNDRGSRFWRLSFLVAMPVVGNEKLISGSFKIHFLVLICEFGSRGWWCHTWCRYRPERLGWETLGPFVNCCNDGYTHLQAPRPPWTFWSPVSFPSGTSHQAHTTLQITALAFAFSLSLLSAIGCDVPHGTVMKQDETHTTGSATSKGRGLWGRLTLHSVM